jgi:AraC-like DNA-binding protein
MNKEKNQKTTIALLNPAITETSIVFPNEKEYIRPGKPCDGQKAIIDELHFGPRVYCPRLLFNVILSGTSSWCPGTSVERRKACDVLLSVVTSGKGKLIIDGRKYELNANDVIFLHGEKERVLTALPSVRFCRHFLTLYSGFVFEIIEQMGLKDVFCIKLSKNKAEHVIQEFEAIDKLICEKPNEFRIKISNKLFELLLFLANETYGDPEKYAVPDYIEKCMNYAMENLDKPLKVIDLANASHTSVRNLNYSFMKFFGISTFHWLKNLKMNLSAMDLKQTRMKIHEIAEKYGFSDQFQYTHTFKKNFGISPTEYRKIIREGIKRKKDSRKR